MPELNILVVLWAIFLYVADALPQGVTQTSLCTTTSEYYGIETTITDYDDFIKSLNSIYSTTTFTGSEVPVHTTVTDFPGIGVITAYGYYDADALRSAGFSIISGVTTLAGSCSTATLPPSPTGSLCEPHGDHWHCQPLSTATTISQSPDILGECEPHDDHWHCPPGVTPPTTPPSPPLASSPSRVSQSETSPAQTLAPPSGTCEPHGDHWHCPEGVPEPHSPPQTTPTAHPTQCEPHGDHWHCPSGISAPANPPPAASSTASATDTGSEPTGSPIQFDGGAGALYGVNTGNSLVARVVTGLVGVVVVRGLVWL